MMYCFCKISRIHAFTHSRIAKITSFFLNNFFFSKTAMLAFSLTNGVFLYFKAKEFAK